MRYQSVLRLITSCSSPLWTAGALGCRQSQRQSHDSAQLSKGHTVCSAAADGCHLVPCNHSASSLTRRFSERSSSKAAFTNSTASRQACRCARMYMNRIDWPLASTCAAPPCKSRLVIPAAMPLAGFLCEAYHGAGHGKPQLSSGSTDSSRQVLLEKAAQSDTPTVLLQVKLLLHDIQSQLQAFLPCRKWIRTVRGSLTFLWYSPCWCPAYILGVYHICSCRSAKTQNSSLRAGRQLSSLSMLC